MFAYCNNNPVVYIDPTGKYIDLDLYPNQQAGREFAEWYTNTDESEEDDSGKPTLDAKIKRTYKSIFYNIEFSGGAGVGFGQEFEIVNLGESVECHYDRIAVQYSDGIWRFGERLELSASVSATQAFEFGIGGMDCFRENGVPIDPTCWALYNDKKTTWTLLSYSNYTCFVGGNIAIGFDLNTFLYDMTEIWG